MTQYTELDDLVESTIDEDINDFFGDLEDLSDHEEEVKCVVTHKTPKEPESAVKDLIYDTECMICCSTMVEPCTLPCRHSFCV